MRRIDGFPLWIGTARDARDIEGVLSSGIDAVVDLAVEEPAISPTRELVYLRFPLLDGEGNPPWLLRSAVDAIVGLVPKGIRTLVACGAGMSRSPAMVAVSLARIKNVRPEVVLGELRAGGPCDVSPGLWSETTTAFSQ